MSEVTKAKMGKGKTQEVTPLEPTKHPASLLGDPSERELALQEQVSRLEIQIKQLTSDKQEPEDERAEVAADIDSTELPIVFRTGGADIYAHYAVTEIEDVIDRRCCVLHLQVKPDKVVIYVKTL